jgi:hypothetical protein
MIDFALTMLIGHDRMRLNRARSSMVEQWPFKPLVAGSIPAALTHNSCHNGRFLRYATLMLKQDFESCAPTHWGKQIPPGARETSSDEMARRLDSRAYGYRMKVARLPAP